MALDSLGIVLKCSSKCHFPLTRVSELISIKVKFIPRKLCPFLTFLHDFIQIFHFIWSLQQVRASNLDEDFESDSTFMIVIVRRNKILSTFIRLASSAQFMIQIYFKLKKGNTCVNT